LLDFLCELYYDARIHEHQIMMTRCPTLEKGTELVAQTSRKLHILTWLFDRESFVENFMFCLIPNFGCLIPLCLKMSPLTFMNRASYI